MSCFILTDMFQAIVGNNVRLSIDAKVPKPVRVAALRGLIKVPWTNYS